MPSWELRTGSKHRTKSGKSWVDRSARPVRGLVRITWEPATFRAWRAALGKRDMSWLAWHYDPAEGKFRFAGKLGDNPVHHTATLLEADARRDGLYIGRSQT